MGYYWTCPYCGAHNDIGERCDCEEARNEYQEADFLHTVGAAPAMEPPKPTETAVSPVPVYLTIQEVADYWSVSYDVVYDLVRKGKLDGFKVGGCWRIPQSALPAYETANSPAQRLRSSTKKPGRPVKRTPVLRL
jgi:excisionase family DNA binding protein